MELAGIPSVSTRTIPFHSTSDFSAPIALVPFIKVMKLEIIARTRFHIVTFGTFEQSDVVVMGLHHRGGLPIVNSLLRVGRDGYCGIPAYFSFELELILFEQLVAIQVRLDIFVSNGSSDFDKPLGNSSPFTLANAHIAADGGVLAQDGRTDQGIFTRPGGFEVDNVFRGVHDFISTSPEYLFESSDLLIGSASFMRCIVWVLNRLRSSSAPVEDVHLKPSDGPEILIRRLKFKVDQEPIYIIGLQT